MKTLDYSTAVKHHITTSNTNITFKFSNNINTPYRHYLASGNHGNLYQLSHLSFCITVRLIVLVGAAIAVTAIVVCVGASGNHGNPHHLLHLSFCITVRPIVLVGAAIAVTAIVVCVGASGNHHCLSVRALCSRYSLYISTTHRSRSEQRKKYLTQWMLEAS